MKNKFLSILLVLCLCLSLLPTAALAAGESTAGTVAYLGENGVSKTCTDYTLLTSEYLAAHTDEDGDIDLTGGWYVVSGELTADGELYFTGSTNLILTDGAKLTAAKGLDGKVLTIYGQSEGTGELIVRRPYVPDDPNNRGWVEHSLAWVDSLTVNGGKLTICSDDITVEDFDLTVIGLRCDDLTVNGGTVDIRSANITATGVDENRDTSGSSYGIDAGAVHINGGSVTATGGNINVSSRQKLSLSHSSSGISINEAGGLTVTGGILTATGGTVNVTGGMERDTYMLHVQSFGISGVPCMTVSGGTVEATGGNVALKRIMNEAATSRNTLAGSYGVSADKLIFTGGTLNDSHGTATTNLWLGESGTAGNSETCGVSTDCAVISGGHINDIRVYETEESGLTGGSFGTLTAVAGEQVSDLLANGYAFYRDESVYMVNNDTSIVTNVTVGEHTCTFAQANEDAPYTCVCGRSYDMEPVSYLNENGIEKYCGYYQLAENCDDDVDLGGYDKPNWYVVQREVTVKGMIDLDSSSCHIILCDGATLTVEEGICDEGNDLLIYGQRLGTGKLVTFGGEDDEYGLFGICCESLTVNGGVIEATGGDDDDGEGWDTCGVYCVEELIVNGGKLTATGGKITGSGDSLVYGDSYGICVRGEGSDDVSVVINGGTVEATGGMLVGEKVNGESCGIYAYSGGDSEMTINGGKLTARGGKIEGKDIYSESCGVYIYSSEDTVLTVNGGEIEMTGGDAAVDADMSTSYGLYFDSDDDADIFMTGGKLTATGGKVTGDRGNSINHLGESCGIYIKADDDTSLTVTGGTLTATGGTVEASGTGKSSTRSVFGKSYGIYFDGDDDDELTVTGGTVKATGGSVSLTRTADSDSGDHADSFAIYGEDVWLGAPGTMELATGAVSMNYSTGLAEDAERGSASAYDLYIDKLTVSGSALKLRESRIDVKITTSGGLKIADLLAEGYAYWKKGYEYAGTVDRFVELSDQTELNGDYIKLCTHSTTSGVCAYCGKNFTPAPMPIYPIYPSNPNPTVSINVTTNPDGSTTKTETKRDGTVVETTKTPDGGTIKTETKTETGTDGTTVETKKTTVSDGSSSTTTTVTDENGSTITSSVSVSSKAAKDAQESGEAVKLPVEVSTGQSGESSTTVDVTIPIGSGSLTVEIPVSNVTPGTVAIIVNEDGSETIVPLSKVTENGIQLTLEKSATIKLVDNSKSFDDVEDSDFFSKAVQWASSRGITGGIGGGKFGPDLSAARAQLVTFLWRAAGCPVVNFAMDFSDVDEDSFYTEAVRWAASLGIVGGYGDGAFGTNDAITREQMAVILYRFAQASGMDTTQGDMALREFADYVSISDYAVTAIQWAVNTGIMQGSNGNLMPKNSCTRAQIVTMLYRLLGE